MTLFRLYQQQRRWQETKTSVAEQLAVLQKATVNDGARKLEIRIAPAAVLIHSTMRSRAQLHVRACVTADKKLHDSEKGGWGVLVIYVLPLARASG